MLEEARIPQHKLPDIIQLLICMNFLFFYEHQRVFGESSLSYQLGTKSLNILQRWNQSLPPFLIKFSTSSSVCRFDLFRQPYSRENSHSMTLFSSVCMYISMCLENGHFSLTPSPPLPVQFLLPFWVPLSSCLRCYFL